jgi:hypothetical protein
MDVQECIDAYVEVSSRVFKPKAYSSWNIVGSIIRGRIKFREGSTAQFWKSQASDRKIYGQFNATILEEVVKEIVVKKGLPENALLKNTDSTAPRV